VDWQWLQRILWIPNFQETVISRSYQT